MNTALHLLAMPLAYPLHPSSQLGYLHGFVEDTFGDRLPVRSHHAFLDILHDMEGIGMAEFFEKYSLVGEEILYLACCYHAAKHGASRGFLPARDFDDALDRYNNYSQNPDNESQQSLVPISREKLIALSDAMESYLDHKLIPSLSDDCLNVIGMTASFCQVFGSIFAARHVRQKTNKRILFLFGGSSYSLPEGSRTLANWNIDGLLVSGSGETPLAHVLEGCLAMEPSADPTGAIDALGLLNVSRTGSPHRPVDLAMSKDFMKGLPPPNYDDYFANLRSLCADDAAYNYALSNLVSIPLEGARGCFAKCDFCHNPNITSQFRTLTGDEVVERTLAMMRKYRVPDITFVDSVSNTWAEGYADYFLTQDLQPRAFMEMRVHAPEPFWVKLALAGVTTIQLGVEAISEPLLQSMRKRTTVMQNLSVTKYMAEMGTNNASNLIIHHPKSTVADVEETRRVMSFLEHFPTFLLSCFVVSYASPIYNELSDEQKNQLHRGFDWLPDELEKFSWPRHLSYTYPRAWVDPAVVEAWLDFQRWYADYVREVTARTTPPTLTVRRDGDRLDFVDTRFAQDHRYSLSGDVVRIYDTCHKPGTMSQIARATGLDAAVVEEHLSELVARKIVIRVGEQYLSVAFRPKSELIENFLKAPRKERRAASTSVATAQVERVGGTVG